MSYPISSFTLWNALMQAVHSITPTFTPPSTTQVISTSNLLTSTSLTSGVTIPAPLKTRGKTVHCCAICFKTKTSNHWYKTSGNPTTRRCQECYRKALAAIAQFCSVCQQTKKSARWYTNPGNPITRRCLKCYNTARTAIERFCSVCQQTKKSARWYKNPGDLSTNRCQQCYDDAAKTKKNTPSKKTQDLLLTMKGHKQSPALSIKLEECSDIAENEEFSILGATRSFHEIDNSLPILQDPQDPTRSRLIETEGTIENITQMRWGSIGDLLSHQSQTKSKELKNQMIASMREWLTLNEYHRDLYTAKLDELAYVSIPIDIGPFRGRSVYAKREIAQFEIIGPYAGALHESEESLSHAMRLQGQINTSSYLFSTRSSTRAVDGFKRGNVLTLVNTGQLGNNPQWQQNNLAVVQFGKNLNFYVAVKNISKDEELLVDYGPNYNPNKPIKKEE